MTVHLSFRNTCKSSASAKRPPRTRVRLWFMSSSSHQLDDNKDHLQAEKPTTPFPKFNPLMMWTATEGEHAIGDKKLYTKTWLPDGEPRAKVIFIHGFNDHINRYYDLFPTLASEPYNFAVYGFDQRGWGRSVANPSEQGLTGPTSLVISDIVSFINTQLPSAVPVFVAGHSMGGGEALTLASSPEYASVLSQIRGWILESPFIQFPKGYEPSHLKVFIGRLAGKLLPNKKLFNPVPAENCTRDPAVIADLNADKLLHGYGTLEGLSGLLDRTEHLNEGKVKLQKEVRSLWLGHGTGDKATSYEGSKKWFDQQTQLEDKEFKTYEGWAHQLHADLPDDRDIFPKDLGDWILARCGDVPAKSASAPVGKKNVKEDVAEEEGKVAGDGSKL